MEGARHESEEASAWQPEEPAEEEMAEVKSSVPGSGKLPMMKDVVLSGVKLRASFVDEARWTGEFIKPETIQRFRKHLEQQKLEGLVPIPVSQRNRASN